MNFLTNQPTVRIALGSIVLRLVFGNRVDGSRSMREQILVLIDIGQMTVVQVFDVDRLEFVEYEDRRIG